MKYINQEYIFKGHYKRKNLHFVCLTDLHIRHNTSEKRLERLLPEIRKFKKLDAIFITGDIMNSADQAMNLKVANRAIKWLGDLAKIAPVFMVYGNHDIEGHSPIHKHRKIPKIPTEFRRKVAKIPGVIVLQNNLVETDDFCVFGLEMDHNYYQTGAKGLFVPEIRKQLENQLDRILKSECAKLPDKPRVFLFHSPVYGDLLKEKLTDFDLILTGHMHNGCLPRPFLKLPSHKGLIGPNKNIFPNYARGHLGQLLILAPITTLPKHLRVLNSIFPTYYTEIKLT